MKTNHFKRALSYILVFAMILSTCAGLTMVSVFAFSDTQSHWAEAEINTWASKGVLNGYEDGTFLPDGPITRAEFAKVIVAAKGATAYTDINFSDVAGDEWFVSYLRKAVSAGYINGYDDGAFRPDDLITREEACAVFARAYHKTGTAALEFTDAADISAWAESYVQALVSDGAVSGYEDGNFRPQNTITRAESVKILDAVAVEASSENMPITGGGVIGGGSGGSGGGGGGGGSSSTRTHNVVFHATEGSFGSPTDISKTVSVKAGNVIGAKAPEKPIRTDYDFAGWYPSKSAALNLDSSKAWNLESDKVNSDLDLYAGWVTAKASFTVTFDARGGSPVAAQTVERNQAAVRPANDPARNKYLFGGWYTDETCTTAYSFTEKVTSDITLYAKWTIEEQYQGQEVVISSETPKEEDQSKGEILVSIPTGVASEKVTVNIMPDENYMVAGQPVISYIKEDGTTDTVKQVEENADGTFSFTIPEDIKGGTTITITPTYQEKPKPTAGPTTEPTAGPTAIPSAPPTAAPSEEPSDVTLWDFGAAPFTDREKFPDNGERQVVAPGAIDNIDGLYFKTTANRDLMGSKKTFTDGSTFQRGIKTGKPGTFNSDGTPKEGIFYFTPEKTCEVTVYAVSGSGSGSADREVVIASGKDKGDIAASLTVNGDASDPRSILSAAVEGGKPVYIYGTDNIQVFAIKAVYTDGPIPPKKHKVEIADNIEHGSISIAKREQAQTASLAADAEYDYWNNDSILKDQNGNYVANDTQVVSANQEMTLNKSSILFGSDMFSKYDSGINVHFMQGKDNPSGGSATTVPTGGSYYKIKILGDGKLSITSVQMGSNKAFFILRQRNGVVTALVNGETSPSLTLRRDTWDDVFYGDEYYVFANGSKAGLMDYLFVPEGAAEPDFTPIPVPTPVPEPVYAVAGDTIVVTAKADPGYTVQSVTTTPNVQVNDSANPVFTFVMPDSDVTVGALFTPEGQTAHTVTAAQPEHGQVSLKLADTNAASLTDYGSPIGPGLLTESAPPATLQAVSGDRVQVVVTPEGGYELDQITAAGTAGALTVGQDGIFTMPDSDATVTVTLKAAAADTFTVAAGTVTGGTLSFENTSGAGVAEASLAEDTPSYSNTFETKAETDTIAFGVNKIDAGALVSGKTLDDLKAMYIGEVVDFGGSKVLKTAQTGTGNTVYNSAFDVASISLGSEKPAGAYEVAFDLYIPASLNPDNSSGQIEINLKNSANKALNRIRITASSRNLETFNTKNGYASSTDTTALAGASKKLDADKWYTVKFSGDTTKLHTVYVGAGKTATEVPEIQTQIFEKGSSAAVITLDGYAYEAVGSTNLSSLTYRTDRGKAAVGTYTDNLVLTKKSADPDVTPTPEPTDDPKPGEPIQAKPGDVIKVTGTPQNTGAVIKTISSVPTAEFTKLSDNVYTFVMPASNVAVDAVFEGSALPEDFVIRADLPIFDGYAQRHQTDGDGETVDSGHSAIGEITIGDKYKMDSKTYKYKHTDGKEYTFTRSWQGGAGSASQRSVSFTPTSPCVVTVVFDGNNDSAREQYIYQGSKKLAGAPASEGVVRAEVDTPGEPVYTYGGSMTKNVYAIFVEFVEPAEVASYKKVWDFNGLPGENGVSVTSYDGITTSGSVTKNVNGSGESLLLCGVDSVVRVPVDTVPEGRIGKLIVKYSFDANITINGQATHILNGGGDAAVTYFYTNADVAGDGTISIRTNSGTPSRSFLKSVTRTTAWTKPLTGKVTNNSGKDLAAGRLVFTNNETQNRYETPYTENYSVELPMGYEYTISVEGVDAVCTTLDTNIVTVYKQNPAHPVEIVAVTPTEVTGEICGIDTADLPGLTLTFKNSRGEETSAAITAVNPVNDSVLNPVTGTLKITLMPNDTYTVTAAGAEGYTLSALSQTYRMAAGYKNPFKNILFVKEVPAVDYSSLTNGEMTVGPNGTYRTIGEALKAVEKMTGRGANDRVVLKLEAGETFEEQVIVNANNVTLSTDAANPATVTWYYGVGYLYYSAHNGYYDQDYAVAKTEKDSATKWGCTVLVNGKGFLAENINFDATLNLEVRDAEIADGVEPAEPKTPQYSDGLAKKPERTKALDARSQAATERAAAMAVAGANAEFYQCSFRSSQDTLWTGSSAAYFKNCSIEGNTDYIFGGNSVVFDTCDLVWGGYTGKAKGGYITACKNSSADDNGYLFLNCTVKNSTVSGVLHETGGYGRNWGGQNCAVYFVNTIIGSGVSQPDGWKEMGGALSNSKLYVKGVYAENDVNKTNDLTKSQDNPNGALAEAPAAATFFGSWTPVHYSGDVPALTEYTSVWDLSKGAQAIELSKAQSPIQIETSQTNDPSQPNMTIDPTNGGLKNTDRPNGDAWCSWSQGAKLIIPVVNGSVVSVRTYYKGRSFTVNGVTLTTTTEDSILDYTYEGPGGSIEIVAGEGGGYIASVKVVSPAEPEPFVPQTSAVSYAANDTVSFGADNPASGSIGSRVTFTAEPKSGYTVTDVKIKKTEDGSDVTDAVSLVGGENHSYQFTMPNYAVTVEVTTIQSSIVSGSVTGLEEADKGSAKLILEEGGQFIPVELTDGSYSVRLLAGKTYTVYGVIGGSCAYTLDRQTLTSADTGAIAATKVTAAPAAGQKTYNFTDNSQIPGLESARIPFKNFVTKDGIVSIHVTDPEQGAVQYYNTHGLTMTAGSISIAVAGDSTITFKRCLYAGNATITPPAGVTPGGVQSMTGTTDGDSLAFAYTGGAAVLEFAYSGSYLHGIEVNTTGSEPPAVQTKDFKIQSDGTVTNMTLTNQADSQKAYTVNETIETDGKGKKQSRFLFTEIPYGTYTVTAAAGAPRTHEFTAQTITVDENTADGTEAGAEYFKKLSSTAKPQAEISADDYASMYDATVTFSMNKTGATPSSFEFVSLEGSKASVYGALGAGAEDSDVFINVDTTKEATGTSSNGKFNSAARRVGGSRNVQTNAGTQVTVPVAPGSVVTFVTTDAAAQWALAAENPSVVTDTSVEKHYKFTYNGTEEGSITLQQSGGRYLEKITIVTPAKAVTPSGYTVSGTVDSGVKSVTLRPAVGADLNGVIEGDRVSFSNVPDGVYDIIVVYQTGYEADLISVNDVESSQVEVSGADISSLVVTSRELVVEGLGVITASEMKRPAGVNLNDKSALSFAWNTKATADMKRVFGDPLDSGYTQKSISMNAGNRTLETEISLSARQAGAYKLLVLSQEYNNRYYTAQLDNGGAINPASSQPGIVAAGGGTNLAVTVYDLGIMSEGTHTVSVTSAVSSSVDFYALGLLPYKNLSDVITAGGMTLIGNDNGNPILSDYSFGTATDAYTEEFAAVFGENGVNAGNQAIGWLGVSGSCRGTASARFEVKESQASSGNYRLYLLGKNKRATTRFNLNKVGGSAVASEAEFTISDSVSDTSTNIYTYDLGALEAGIYEFEITGAQSTDFVAFGFGNI